MSDEDQTENPRLSMKPYMHFLTSKWFARRKNPRLRKRLIALNKMLCEGERLRGWHPAPTLTDNAYQRNLVSKRWFIGKFGRAAWNSLSRDCIWKQGKRAYVRAEAIEDRAWLPREVLFPKLAPPSIELYDMLEDLKAEAIKLMHVGGLAA